MRIKTSVLVMFENVGSYVYRIKPESYLQWSRSDYPPTWVFPNALTVRHNNAEMPFCVKQIHSNYHQAVLILSMLFNNVFVIVVVVVVQPNGRNQPKRKKNHTR